MPTDSDSAEADRDGRTESVKSSSGSQVRAYVFAIAAFALAAVCVVLALQYFVAEHLPQLTEASLQAATELWSKKGPANYNMDIELRGAQPGNVHVEVRNGEVTAQTRDSRVPARRTWDTWSVPGMLDTLSQDLATAEDPEKMIDAAPGTKWRLRCEFEPEFGVPAIYHRLVTGGPEVYWRVTLFEPK